MINLLILPKTMRAEQVREIYSRYRPLAHGHKLHVFRLAKHLKESEHLFLGQKQIRGWIHKDCKNTQEMSEIMLYIYEQKSAMRDEPEEFFNHLSSEGFIL